MFEPDLANRSSRMGQDSVEREVSTLVHAEAKKKDGLTVLIRARNHRSFLPGALRSALEALDRLEEAGFPAEILVIDDASLDGSQKLMRSVQALYNEPRLRALCLAESVGPERMRSLGIGASAFRYVCIMDAENELVPANVQLFLRGVSDTGAAMVYGNVVEKRDGEVTGVRSNMPVIPGLAKARRLDAFSIVDSEKLSVLEESAVADSEETEGWTVALRLLAAEMGVVFVPAVLGYYHERSIWMGRELRRVADGSTTPRRGRARAGSRERDITRIGRIYHPEVGFLDG